MPRPRNLAVCIAVPVLLISTGCSSITDPRGERQDEIRAQRAIWDAHHIDEYSFELRRSCFCAFVVWLRASVVDGEMVSLDPVEDDPTIPPFEPSDFPTLSELFDVLDDAVAQDAHSITVDWDAEYGFPVEFYIDYLEQAADEELGYQVRAFSPAS